MLVQHLRNAKQEKQQEQQEKRFLARLLRSALRRCGSRQQRISTNRRRNRLVTIRALTAPLIEETPGRSSSCEKIHNLRCFRGPDL